MPGLILTFKSDKSFMRRVIFIIVAFWFIAAHVKVTFVIDCPLWPVYL
jgi:hypothetical protein